MEKQEKNGLNGEIQMNEKKKQIEQNQNFFFKPDNSKNMEKWNEWRNTDKCKKMDKIELEVFSHKINSTI